MLTVSDETSYHVLSIAISTKETLICSDPIMNTTTTMLADVFTHGLAYHAISTRCGGTTSSATHHHSSILLISSLRVMAVSLENEGL